MKLPWFLKTIEFPTQENGMVWEIKINKLWYLYKYICKAFR
jgi:hypothetical protein